MAGMVKNGFKWLKDWIQTHCRLHGLYLYCVWDVHTQSGGLRQRDMLNQQHDVWIPAERGDTPNSKGIMTGNHASNIFKPRGDWGI